MQRTLARSTAALSAVHRGVAFEERSRRVLQTHMSMSMRRVGGASDGGIDLQGWWWIPSPAPSEDSSTQPGVLYTDTGERRRRIRVIAQCKAETRKMGPNYVREMEGVLHTLNANALQAHVNGEISLETPTIPIVAIIISQSNFTRATRLRAMSSPLPFILMYLPPVSRVVQESRSEQSEEEEDQIGSAIWNVAVSGEKGVLRGQGELRWERKAGDIGRPGLWWAGRKLRNWVPPETQVDEEVDEELQVA
ncbi:hypothetical protein DACRYDRAFT_23909 [Dacryopinax primogenitus]|uniref:Required for respiratory growth protein 7, mitochondrial n=1 Tax=Dacryopinax primogenitus (strain DJM 731) TaxID=1858805 RepID=M5G6F1_DACPD|nr:uncharacterized protein DACRYDRAFT_23909 [Dacryopinax primogenitus]EJT99342.1 hypothetical protein DACRYDRAFT_23909 [Dacryopinax primogenitus]